MRYSFLLLYFLPLFLTVIASLQRFPVPPDGQLTHGPTSHWTGFSMVSSHIWPPGFGALIPPPFPFVPIDSNCCLNLGITIIQFGFSTLLKSVLNKLCYVGIYLFIYLLLNLNCLIVSLIKGNY